MATTETENRQLVSEFHRRVLTENDLDAVEELVAPDYVEHNSAVPGGVLDGREAAKEFWAGLFEGVPDLEIEEVDAMTEGNTVVTRHIGRGTHEGEFMDMPATGNSFEIQGIDVYEIEDGKLSEAWISLDTLGMLQQLGAIPEMPAPEEA